MDTNKQKCVCTLGLVSLWRHDLVAGRGPSPCAAATAAAPTAPASCPAVDRRRPMKTVRARLRGAATAAAPSSSSYRAVYVTLWSNISRTPVFAFPLGLVRQSRLRLALRLAPWLAPLAVRRAVLHPRGAAAVRPALPLAVELGAFRL